MTKVVMKRCPKCEQTKPVDAFYFRNGKPRVYCKACCSDMSREYRKKNSDRLNAYCREWRKNPKNARAVKAGKYGLTLEEYDGRVAVQAGCCAICGDDAPLQVDHDHDCCDTEASSCGKCNRDLLCGSCNTGLARFKDDPDRLIAAAEYLRKWKVAVSV